MGRPTAPWPRVPWYVATGRGAVDWPAPATADGRAGPAPANAEARAEGASVSPLVAVVPVGDTLKVGLNACSRVRRGGEGARGARCESDGSLAQKAARQHEWRGGGRLAPGPQVQSQGGGYDGDAPLSTKPRAEPPPLAPLPHPYPRLTWLASTMPTGTMAPGPVLPERLGLAPGLGSGPCALLSPVPRDTPKAPLPVPLPVRSRGDCRRLLDPRRLRANMDGAKEGGGQPQGAGEAQCAPQHSTTHATPSLATKAHSPDSPRERAALSAALPTGVVSQWVPCPLTSLCPLAGLPALGLPGPRVHIGLHQGAGGLG
jgi:hypothetical protein